MINIVLFTEISFTALGALFFFPSVIREQKICKLEPFYSLWMRWATMNQNNPFPKADAFDYVDPIHEAGWYDLEFEQWLDEIGAEPWNNYYKLYNLNKYLLKHKFIERKCYWNHWVYRINKEKLI